MLRIKICGITNVSDAMLAVDAGADALGLIFVPDTPRVVTPEQAAEIVAALPPFVCPVGVFWDHDPAEVEAIAARCRLGAVQLHGDERPETVAVLRGPVIKTIKLGGAADLERLDQYRVAAFLLDSPARWSEGQPRPPVSWPLARQAAARRRVILSGGLTPETVAPAIRVARPFGVDVSSGVEARPGRKDPDKVRSFIRAAREAAAAGPAEARHG